MRHLQPRNFRLTKLIVEAQTTRPVAITKDYWGGKKNPCFNNSWISKRSKKRPIGMPKVDT